LFGLIRAESLVPLRRRDQPDWYGRSSVNRLGTGDDGISAAGNIDHGYDWIAVAIDHLNESLQKTRDGDLRLIYGQGRAEVANGYRYKGRALCNGIAAIYDASLEQGITVSGLHLEWKCGRRSGSR
jgi:hypothetical protein